MVRNLLVMMAMPGLLLLPSTCGSASILARPTAGARGKIIVVNVLAIVFRYYLGWHFEFRSRLEEKNRTQGAGRVRNVVAPPAPPPPLLAIITTSAVILWVSQPVVTDVV